VRRGLACAAAVWLALALAACGGDSSQRTATPKVTATGTAPPAPTPQPLDYVGDARTALKRGAIAVVDFSNRVVVAPSRMDVNAEMKLSRLRWSGWGSERATARGDLRTLICEPTCANGLLEHSRGDLVLSAPKRCGKGRFYTRSSMTYEEPGTGKTRAPATYLRTPPC
jgi:hypothetical protein